MASPPFLCWFGPFTRTSAWPRNPILPSLYLIPQHQTDLIDSNENSFVPDKMIAPSFIAASAFALQAAAFLIPPEVAEAAAPPADGYHLTTFKDPKSDVYPLPCTGCPLAIGPSETEDWVWTEGVDNVLSLNFTIDDAHNTLLLNDRTFFPVTFPIPLNLWARQYKQIDDGELHPNLHLGFALETYPPITSSDESGTTIIPVHFTVLDIAGKPVNVDTVAIDLVQLPAGELFIGKIDLIPAPEEAPGADCTNQLCRLRAIILSRIHAMIEAAKARAHKAGKMIKSGCHKMKSHGGHKAHKNGHKDGHKDKHHRPHHHKAHHRHAHGLMRFINRSMKLFIIPALLGIVGGLVASIIGMMVGQGLVYLWFRFVRRNQRGPYSRIALAEEAVEEEKEVLIEGESPPDYDELEVAKNDKE